MKNLVVVLAAALFISLTACAQTPKDLPVKVKTSFDQKFPGVQKVKWSKENATEWEAEFKMAGKEYSANYTAEGDLDGNRVRNQLHLRSRQRLPKL